MNDPSDTTLGWIRKADGDLRVAQICLNARESYDAVCFHSQQAAEKFLKAFLELKGLLIPKTHQIEQLVELCSNFEPAFEKLYGIGIQLTPYSIRARYDIEFWPPERVAMEAVAAAETVREQVMAALPEKIVNHLSQSLKN